LRQNDRNLPLSIRMLQSILIAFWLWLFLPVVAKLHLLQSPDSFISILIVLAFAEWVHSRLFRFCAAFVASVVYMIYYFRPIGDTVVQGITELFTQDIHGILPLMHGELPGDPLQTHLFLLILAVLYWLIVYAASRPKTWILYSLLGVLVLALIDGNTSIHPNAAMVGVLLISILNLGVIQFASLAMHLRMQGAGWPRFFVSFGVVVSAVFSAGFLLPKHQATWANPFAKTGNGIAEDNGSSVHMVGYQLDNTRLGGSFILDNTPVLSVTADRPSYLRGECLTNYTGKGWVSEDLGSIPNNYEYEYVGGTFSSTDHFAFSHMPTKSLVQSVQVLSDKLDTHDLLAGWAITKVESISGMPQNATLSMDLLGANLNAPKLKTGESYVVQTAQLENPYNVLASSKVTYAEMKQQLSGQGMAYYTQLPWGFPDRVHQLALKVVGNATTEYEMVMRIEEYLKQNYAYTNSGVPVPGVNQDYVDQFLFESKKGYCNNFSSAMAVMLRSLNIPTRFVTGFTDGELDPNYSGTENRYTIRESDAHSWVEVLFPHYGWIPFDPTPNYNLDFASAATTGQNPQSEQQVPTKVTKIPPVLPQISDTGSSQSTQFEWTSLLWWVLKAGMLILVISGFVIWLYRKQLIVGRLLRVWTNEEVRVPSRPIAHLVRVMQKKGAVSENAVTVRDLQDAARNYGIENVEYEHFVRTVEGTWYGGEIPAAEDRLRIQKTWKTWFLSVLRSSRRK
jgi:transglutaminase-like putative cysteine protease